MSVPQILLLTCLVLAGVQVAYWLVFLLSLRTRPDEAPADPLPGISVIVCAHDEEQNLRELIPLLLEQDHPDFEVIIVEDQSNDGTYDLLLNATKADPRLKMVKVTSRPAHIPGKKYALTLGIRAAAHDIVLLTDADCRPADRTWVRLMAAKFRAGIDIVTGVSPYLHRGGLLNAFIRFETWVTALQYTSFARIGAPYMGVGRNLAYRKKLFLEGKGFHSHLSVMGGDDDLFVNEHARSGNTEVAAGASTLTWSIPKESLHQFLNQKIRHLTAGRQYRFIHHLMLAPFTLSWVLILPLSLLQLLFGLSGILTGLLLLRWVIMGLALRLQTLQYGQRQHLLLVPVMDVLFAVYYLVAGLAALFTRKIVWKT